MTIQIGDQIPSSTLMTMTSDGPAPVQTENYFEGRTVVLFAVPGAFTPTCSAQHLPGFVNNASAILEKGVDAIACCSVNDVFVMDAWAKSSGATDTIGMLADGNGDFARAMGLEMDITKVGLGMRSKRYAAVVKNGVVTALHVEEPGAFKVSSAEHILSQL